MDEEFHNTFCGPMKNINGSALLASIWKYADSVIESEYQNCTAWDWEVAHVYENGDKKYHHKSIPVPKDNTCLVVVLDVGTKEFYGHHILDLHEKRTKTTIQESKFTPSALMR